MPEGYYARWVLPDPVDPPDTICFQINVPNEVHHLAAFYGAIYTLTYSKNWQRDNDHTAALASRVWTRIFDALIAGNCAVPARPLQGIEQEDFMPLRVDCDCNVFVTCCDGTEQQILNANQVRDLLKTQPAEGSPQPQPGGGCVTYNGVMGAAAPWYVPTVVSEGDTLEFMSWDGVTNDGGNLAWRAADGGLFFAGANTGVTTLVTGDPLNTVPHLKVIAAIDGDFFDVFPGPFTVPSGYTNAQVTLQVNDDPLSNNAGQISFALKVCNNQSASWSFHHDLSTSPNGWMASLDGFSGGQSVWSAGQGWEQVNCYENDVHTAQYDIVYIELPFAHPTTVTHMDMLFNATVGTLHDGGGNKVQVQVAGVWSDIATLASVDGNGQTMTFDGSIANVARVRVLIYGADELLPTCPTPGTALFRVMNMSGVGVAPF